MEKKKTGTAKDIRMKYSEIIKKLKSLESPRNKTGMARFGINTENAFGVSVYELRGIAKQAGKDHNLAKELWDSGFHEARILAGMVDEPGKVTERQMQEWVKEFNSWDLCDQSCLNLFCNTKFAYKKVFEWSSREEEFVKRAAFALMACLAWKDKEAADSKLEKFFPIIKRHVTDERNYVKKAANWALRQIGKRNLALNKKAIKTAGEIQKIDSKAAKWIAKDALRELQSEAVQKRLKEKEEKK